MAAILKFKKMFRKPKGDLLSYKHSHFLNTMPASKLNEILVFSEADQLTRLIPSFHKKKVLFLNDQKHKFVFKKIMAKEPAHFVNYVFTGDSVHMQSPGYFTMMGSLDKLSFKSGQFDVIICPLVLQEQENIGKFFNKMCQMLTNGGRIVFSLRHPQLEHMLYNQNPSETGSPENSISRYFEILRAQNFYVEQMTEGEVNLSLKPFFTLDGEFDYYHQYKGIPLTYLVRAVKFVK